VWRAYRKELTNALSDGTIGTKAHKILGKVTVGVYSHAGSPENFQGTHIQGGPKNLAPFFLYA